LLLAGCTEPLPNVGNNNGALTCHADADCALPQATSACTSGLCAIATCAGGYADCDKLADNGCEAHLVNDDNNCGACGQVCAQGLTCQMGTCGGCRSGADCAMGQVCLNGACARATCTDGIKDGNETDVDCGGVDCVPCATGKACLVNSDCIQGESCQAGICMVNGGGGCPCNLQHAKPSCPNGVCAIASCDAGHADCNLNTNDGCEVILTSDSLNCGACGTVCPTGATCQNGVCQKPGCRSSADCAVGQACVNGVCQTASCSDGIKDGQETDVDCGGVACAPCATGKRCLANSDCIQGEVCQAGVCAVNGGGCGACNPPNATGQCANGACVIVICNPGFADCDLLITNGCEVNVGADPLNCGACGVVCPTGKACHAGVCQ
jgi:hypothetical protein